MKQTTSLFPLETKASSSLKHIKYGYIEIYVMLLVILAPCFAGCCFIIPMRKKVSDLGDNRKVAENRRGFSDSTFSSEMHHHINEKSIVEVMGTLMQTLDFEFQIAMPLYVSSCSELRQRLWS